MVAVGLPQFSLERPFMIDFLEHEPRASGFICLSLLFQKSGSNVYIVQSLGLVYVLSVF